MTKPLSIQRMESLQRIEQFFEFAQFLEKRMSTNDQKRNLMVKMIKGEAPCAATRDSVIEMAQFEGIGMAFEMSQISIELSQLFNRPEVVFTNKDLMGYVKTLTSSVSMLSAACLFIYWTGSLRGDFKQERLRNTTAAVFDELAKAQGS